MCLGEFNPFLLMCCDVYFQYPLSPWNVVAIHAWNVCCIFLIHVILLYFALLVIHFDLHNVMHSLFSHLSIDVSTSIESNSIFLKGFLFFEAPKSLLFFFFNFHALSYCQRFFISIWNRVDSPKHMVYSLHFLFFFYQPKATTYLFVLFTFFEGSLSSYFTKRY